MAKKKTKKMPTKLAPGTQAGDAYLDRQDIVRRRRGGPGSHGRTLGGQRTTARSHGTRYNPKKKKGK